MTSDDKSYAMMETVVVTAAYVLGRQRRRARISWRSGLSCLRWFPTREDNVAGRRCIPVELKVRIVSEARLGSKVGGVGLRYAVFPPACQILLYTNLSWSPKAAKNLALSRNNMHEIVAVD